MRCLALMGSPTGISRIRQLARKIAKWLAAAGALLVLLVALAYKDVIPGGDSTRDQIETWKIKWDRYQFEREAASVPAGAVVFVGSSSVDAFPLSVYYPGAPWLNRGLATESAKDLAERLEATMPIARPAGVVVWTGMNDLRSDAQPPPVVVERITRVLDVLAEIIAARYPGVPVTLIEILPLCDTKPNYLEDLHFVNAKLAEVAQARGVVFVKTDRAPLVSPEGRLSPLLAAKDRKHLNLAGYGVLAKWLLEEGGAATAALAPR